MRTLLRPVDVNWNRRFLGGVVPDVRGVVGLAVVLVVLVPALLWVSSSGAGDPLRRPLHLPRLAPGGACPISPVDSHVSWKRLHIFGGSGIGPGPVYPGLGKDGGRLVATRDEQYGGPWYGQKVFWYVRPSYRGPALIRGRALGGPQEMRFNGRRIPLTELRIAPGETAFWQGQPLNSRGVPSAVRVVAPGCYGVQIDGTTFSRVVVFRVDLVG